MKTTRLLPPLVLALTTVLRAQICALPIEPPRLASPSCMLPPPPLVQPPFSPPPLCPAVLTPPPLVVTPQVTPCATLATRNEATEVTLIGTLVNGRVAIGGETSGWALRYTDTAGAHTVEVEFAAGLAARARAGVRVRVTGEFRTQVYTERGEVRVLFVKWLEYLPASNE